MTKRFQLKKYISALGEIDDIMSAMKNLAFIEVSKLNKYANMQKKVVNSIDELGADYLTFSNQFLPDLPLPEPQVYILIGSERGFCGSFNDNILKHFQSTLPNESIQDAHILVIGQKLIDKFEDIIDGFEKINGPTITEEITEVILIVLNYLKNINQTNPNETMLGNWSIIYNEYQNDKPAVNSFNLLHKLCEYDKATFPYRAVMNIKDEQFFIEYLDHYLFANLYHIFYQSLISENYARLRHIEGAKSKLEKKSRELTQKMNRLRQEEITEEIENILISVESLSSDHLKKQ